MTSPKFLDQHQLLISQYMHAGLLPFMAGAFLPWVFADWEAAITQWFLLYSGLILAFLSGILWAVGLFIEEEQSPRPKHFHGAIIFSLIPLFAFALPPLWQAGTLACGFFALLRWEKKHSNHFYTLWYSELRHKITFIVLACHMLVIWSLMRP